MGRRNSQNQRRIPSGMQVHRNEYRPNLNGINQKTGEKSNDASQPLCSTTGSLAVCGRFSLPVVVAICCRLLQMGVGCRSCCRPFTNCCNRLQNAKICGFGVPMAWRRSLLR